ncbi:MAG: hypothetical protein AAF810_06205 [Cyanobacteria bacterium P01_D01_bin.36]
MAAFRTVILEAHDGSRWRSLSLLPTCDDAKLNQYLLWENPTLSPPPKKSEGFPPLPDDCSGQVQSRLKGLAYYVTTCFDLAAFKAGVENAAKSYKEHSEQVMTEMKGAIAMAQVLADGNIPVRFIILLDY